MEDIKYGIFFLFESSVVLGCLFSWPFVPETKGFSLEEMVILFTREDLAYTWQRQAELFIQENRASHVARALSVTDEAEVHVQRIKY